MSAFDPDVRAGDIRIFADAREPLVALVLDDCGCRGWRLVPVSSLPLPGDAADLVLGARVLQLWNALTAPRSFVARSWLVEHVSAEDLALVRRESAEVGGLPARLSAYQLKHLVALPRPFAAPSVPAVPRTVAFWRRPGWLAAASIAIVAGAAWYLSREDVSEEESALVMTLAMRRPPVVEELEEMAEGAEAVDEVAALKPVEIAPARLPLPELPAAEAPRVAPRVPMPKMVSAPPVRNDFRRPDAVLSADAGADAPRVRATLRWLKARQAADGAWGEDKLRDTALAVIAIAAHGETGASAEFGETFTRGVRYLAEAKVRKVDRKTGDPLVCALCCGYAATRNPNVKAAAEAWLEQLGDRRSVEVGRDWSGILADLTANAGAKGASASGQVAAERPADEIATASLFVLDLIKRSAADRRKTP